MSRTQRITFTLSGATYEKGARYGRGKGGIAAVLYRSIALCRGVPLNPSDAVLSSVKIRKDAQGVHVTLSIPFLAWEWLSGIAQDRGETLTGYVSGLGYHYIRTVTGTDKAPDLFTN